MRMRIRNELGPWRRAEYRRHTFLVESGLSVFLVCPEEELHGVVLDVGRGHHLARDGLVAGQLALPVLQPVHQRQQQGQSLLYIQYMNRCLYKTIYFTTKAMSLYYLFFIFIFLNIFFGGQLGHYIIYMCGILHNNSVLNLFFKIKTCIVAYRYLLC